MKESHATQLLILIGFIFVLIIAVAFPIVVSIRRRKKASPAETEKQDLDQSASTRVEIQQPTAAQSSDAVRSNDSSVVSEKLETKPEPLLEKETHIGDALRKTEQHFWGRIRSILSGSSSKRDEVLEHIEEVLYTSDLGPQMVEFLLEDMREHLSSGDLSDLKKMQDYLRTKMSELLKPLHDDQLQKTEVRQVVQRNENGPTVIMIVGVNGAGKTTSIGKMAAQLASQGERVLVAAGDTFRAAAGGQLKAWTERATAADKMNQGLVEIFWPPNVTDPAAVAFDSIEKAKAQGFSFVLLDTAGRLHSQGHLMDELKKVKRVMGKVIPEAPHETWVVLDGNAGQNAVLQAKEFNQSVGLTGVVLTKLDGTAKGGAALSVVQQLQKPIRLIGIGEKVSDLRIFNWKDYLNAILGTSS